MHTHIRINSKLIGGTIWWLHGHMGSDFSPLSFMIKIRWNTRLGCYLLCRDGMFRPLFYVTVSSAGSRWCLTETREVLSFNLCRRTIALASFLLQQCTSRIVQQTIFQGSTGIQRLWALTWLSNRTRLTSTNLAVSKWYHNYSGNSFSQG